MPKIVQPYRLPLSLNGVRPVHNPPIQPGLVAALMEGTKGLADALRLAVSSHEHERVRLNTREVRSSCLLPVGVELGRQRG